MKDFKTKADQVKNLKSSPSNDDLLILYAFFKQATVGDNETGNHLHNSFQCFNLFHSYQFFDFCSDKFGSLASLDKPGMLDFKGKAKWEAWNGKKGMYDIQFILFHFATI